MIVHRVLRVIPVLPCVSPLRTRRCARDPLVEEEKTLQW